MAAAPDMARAPKKPTRVKRLPMTRTIFFTATTLDGYLADEKDSLDWLFKQDIDSAGPNSYDEFISGGMSLAWRWISVHYALRYHELGTSLYQVSGQVQWP